MGSLTVWWWCLSLTSNGGQWSHLGKRFLTKCTDALIPIEISVLDPNTYYAAKQLITLQLTHFFYPKYQD